MAQDIEDLKIDRDRRINDLQRMMEKEKENYKFKLTEYEQKAKEADNRKN